MLLTALCLIGATLILGVIPATTWNKLADKQTPTLSSSVAITLSSTAQLSGYKILGIDDTNPQFTSLNLEMPTKTVYAEDRETIFSLVRQIHAKGKDAVIWAWMEPEQQGFSESLVIIWVGYYKRGDLPPDSGKRSALPSRR